jgi:hypothetical protein
MVGHFSQFTEARGSYFGLDTSDILFREAEGFYYEKRV